MLRKVAAKKAAKPVAGADKEGGEPAEVAPRGCQRGIPGRRDGGLRGWKMGSFGPLPAIEYRLWLRVSGMGWCGLSMWLGM